MSSSTYTQEVTESIIRQLKTGTAPWTKPWKAGQHFRPYNPITGKTYFGINALWLMTQAENKGYSDARWMTFKQANSLDATVNKGEKATTIQYWKWSEDQIKRDEKGKPVRDEGGEFVKKTVAFEQPRVFYAKVFNADQLNGLPHPIERLLLSPFERHHNAEQLLDGSGANLQLQEGNRAFYKPSTDIITLPLREQFHSPDGFYATALHELGHWTGHESRLNRDLAHPFGSQGYAKEELRAEIASLMLGEKLEIGHDPSKHVAYINSWIQALEQDPREIFRAASDAEKIMNFVLEPPLIGQGLENTETIQLQSASRQHVSDPTTLQMTLSTDGQDTEATTQMTHNRSYLAVPYQEKDAAKALGAKWDTKARSWYAPLRTDLKPLEKWAISPENTLIASTPDMHTAFSRAIADAGLVLNGEPIMDGKIHRCPVQGDDLGQSSGAYVGHLDGHPAGYIQNYKTGSRQNWKLNAPVPHLSSLDKARLSAEFAQKRQERANEIEQIHIETARTILAHWDKSTETTNHAYLQSKDVQAYGLKLDTVGTITIPHNNPDGQHWGKTGNLLVPIRDIHGQFWGAQSIDETGRKSLPKGVRKQGCHHVIGEIDFSNKLLFAEGYATAATLHELTGLPVVVTFDSGNLPVVAEAYRGKYPDKVLLIAGDNDHTKLEQQNVGLQKAQEAAKKANGHSLLPRFETGAYGSDWNDLMKMKGKDAVRVDLEVHIRSAEHQHKLAQKKFNHNEQALSKALPHPKKQHQSNSPSMSR